MTQPHPRLDPDLGDAEARVCRAARLAGYLGPTFAALGSTRGQSDRRWFLLDRLEVTVPREHFDALVAAHPDRAAAYLLRGVHAIGWAWEARGSGPGNTVTAEGARLLHERCTMAVADFRRAAALEPEDATPYAFLLRAALGLGWPMAESEATFEEGRRRDPEHYPLYRWMLSHKGAHWFGSDEEMFAFAREAARDAPLGSERHALIVDAHRLKITWLPDEQLIAYASHPSVLSEMAHARAMSIGSSSCRRREWSALVVHDLIEMHCYANDRRATRTELEFLGTRIDPLYFGVRDVEAGSARVHRIHRFAYDLTRLEREAATQRTMLLSVIGGAVFFGLLSIGLVIYSLLQAPPP